MKRPANDKETCVLPNSQLLVSVVCLMVTQAYFVSHNMNYVTLQSLLSFHDGYWWLGAYLAPWDLLASCWHMHVGASRETNFSLEKTWVSCACYSANMIEQDKIQPCKLMPEDLLMVIPHWLSQTMHFWAEIHQQPLTLLMPIPEDSGRTQPIPWLLMPWLLLSPGHQQPWHCTCRMDRSLSSIRNDFNYLHYPNVEKWYKI